MSTAVVNLLDDLLESLSDHLTPEGARRVLEFQFDAATHRRLDILADKANEGQLTADEAAEYEEYIKAMDRIGILQAKARTRLKRVES